MFIFTVHNMCRLTTLPHTILDKKDLTPPRPTALVDSTPRKNCISGNKSEIQCMVKSERDTGLWIRFPTNIDINVGDGMRD